jgi:hypothetical protein
MSDCGLMSRQPIDDNSTKRKEKGGTPVLKRLAAGVVVIAAFLALGVSAGVSATPWQIYRDLADNGRLNHKYSAADLARAFKNPTFQGYHKPTQPAPTLVRHPAGRNPLRTTKTGGTLPFTGLDLTLITVGAVLLIALGGGLRMLVRRQ